MRTHLLEADHAWREAHLGATVGVLAIHGAANPPVHAGRGGSARKPSTWTDSKRARTSASSVAARSFCPAYAAYYRRWGQRYVPPGVDASLVAAHLDAIERNVRLVSPAAVVGGREIVTAS